MRTNRKNRQRMYYALWLENQPVYERDREGNIRLDEDDEPLETGDYENRYSDPMEFRANIHGSGGRLQEMAYGIYEDYDALLYVRKNDLPIRELTLIWYESEPKYRKDGSVDPASADYKVKRVPPSLNETVYLLEKVVG